MPRTRGNRPFQALSSSEMNSGTTLLRTLLTGPSMELRTGTYSRTTSRRLCLTVSACAQFTRSMVPTASRTSKTQKSASKRDGLDGQTFQRNLGAAENELAGALKEKASRVLGLMGGLAVASTGQSRPTILTNVMDLRAKLTWGTSIADSHSRAEMYQSRLLSSVAPLTVWSCTANSTQALANCAANEKSRRVEHSKVPTLPAYLLMVPRDQPGYPLSRHPPSSIQVVMGFVRRIRQAPQHRLLCHPPRNYREIASFATNECQLASVWTIRAGMLSPRNRVRGSRTVDKTVSRTP